MRGDGPRRSGFNRWVVSPLNIILAVATILLLVGEAVKMVPAAVHAMVDKQIAEIRSVDAVSLFHSFGRDLDSHSCNWQMECVVNPAAVAAVGSAARVTGDQEKDLALERMEARRAAEGVKQPVLGSIKHAVLGTPHALYVTARQIWFAGGWAKGMLLACTMFYLLFWGRFGRKPGDNGQSAVFMLLWLPAIVSLEVQVIQWIVGGVYRGVHTLLAEILVLTGYAGGIRVAAELREAWKSPREVHEAINVIRNV